MKQLKSPNMALGLWYLLLVSNLAAIQNQIKFCRVRKYDPEFPVWKRSCTPSSGQMIEHSLLWPFTAVWKKAVLAIWVTSYSASNHCTHLPVVYLFPRLFRFSLIVPYIWHHIQKIRWSMLLILSIKLLYLCEKISLLFLEITPTVWPQPSKKNLGHLIHFTISQDKSIVRHFLTRISCSLKPAWKYIGSRKRNTLYFGSFVVTSIFNLCMTRANSRQAYHSTKPEIWLQAMVTSTLSKLTMAGEICLLVHV